MQKEIHTISNNHLKRLGLKLLIYKIDLQYLLERHMYVGGLFSRNFIKRQENCEVAMSDAIHTVIEAQVHFTNSEQLEFRNQTKKDEVLSKVVEYCMKGWHKKLNEEGENKYYWELRNKISDEDELVYYME